MGKTRTPYPAEFRAQMVELVKAGRTPQELAREFEPTAQTITNWVAQADRDAGVRHDGLTTAERQELTRLRRENRQLKMERDILSHRRPGSRGRREPCHRRVRIHESEPGPLAHSHDGAAARGLDERLLRVADTRAIAACWQ
ncbi:transposase [Paraburkholderia phymatum]|uniref:Transposase n=1 Tax=Paraburkholderia phymatum TaxID=148447 RepID=A0ACC6UEE0_9BURK